MREITMLAILDGWGVGKHNESNPIYMAKKPAVSFIEENFPCGALQASGINVGLSWEDASSSEVGHLILGAGKILYQNYPKISLSIRDNSFFENRVLLDLMKQAKNGVIHFIGTFSVRPVHGAKEHLFSLIELSKRLGIKPSLHLVFDGKENDSPETFNKNLEELKRKLAESNGVLSSISGAYYAMNEAQKPEHKEAFQKALVGDEKTPRFSDVGFLLATSREKNPNIEFIEPSVLEGGKPLKKGDAVVFFNFEGTEFKSTVEALSINKISVATLADYGAKAPVAFPKEHVNFPLGQALSGAGKSQMRIAESERYRSLTFYMNGEREEPFPNEYRAEIPSKKTLSPEKHPEMMAETVTERALMTLREGGFDFVAVNYANPDVIASTGSYASTKRTVEIVDAEIGKLMNAALQENHTLIVVGSHGNAETLLDTKTGGPDTKPNANPVPFYLVKKSLRRTSPVHREKLLTIGLLSDVAPTILELMDVSKPAEMTGESLFSEL